MTKKHLILTVLTACLSASLLLAGCAGNSAAANTESAQQQEGPQAGTESARPSSEPGAVSTAESAASAGSGEKSEVNDANAATVYFTSDISAEGLVKIYDALGWTPEGKVAVKISTGEPPASNYLRPELIGDLVKKVDGTIVECNTAYGGSRSSTAMHRQVAEDHGFTQIADFDLMDEEGEVEWPMTGGTRLDKVIVGSHADNYSDWVILSHVKPHTTKVACFLLPAFRRVPL